MKERVDFMLELGTALQPEKQGGAEGLAMHGPRSPSTSWHVGPFLGWRMLLLFLWGQKYMRP